MFFNAKVRQGEDMPKQTRTTDLTSPKFLFAASVVSIALWFIPFAWMAVYPWRMFVTFIHEGGHALAAILSAGAVERMVIYADASGETYTRGGMPFLIASAGYLTSAAYGALLLALSRQGKNAKTILTINAGLILVLTFAFTDSLFSWGVGLGLTIGLIWIAISGSQPWAHFLLNFMAVQCCLNAFFDLRTLFWISATTSMHSDAVSMEKMTLIPAVVWAAMWAALSLILWGIGLWNYARNGRR